MENNATNETCLVLIPARGGSTGIQRKNMALLGGKPLIEFTIRAAVEAYLPGCICLSTDDNEIRNFGLGFPIEAPFLRPSELAQNESDIIHAVLHAIDWYEKEDDFFPDIVVLLQPTNPFRKPRSIRDAYMSFISTDANSLISVNSVRQHPCEYIIRQRKGFKFVMPPPKKPGRQNFPNVFFVNGAIHITRVSYLRKTGKLFNEESQLFEIGNYESIDIDEPEDLEFANWLYMNKKRLANR